MKDYPYNSEVKSSQAHITRVKVDDDFIRGKALEISKAILADLKKDISRHINPDWIALTVRPFLYELLGRIDQNAPCVIIRTTNETKR